MASFENIARESANESTRTNADIEKKFLTLEKDMKDTAADIMKESKP